MLLLRSALQTVVMTSSWQSLGSASKWKCSQTNACFAWRVRIDLRGLHPLVPSVSVHKFVKLFPLFQPILWTTGLVLECISFRI
jgi:hypothetical protein